jgi:hypothetical protein
LPYRGERILEMGARRRRCATENVGNGMFCLYTNENCLCGTNVTLYESDMLNIANGRSVDDSANVARQCRWKGSVRDSDHETLVRKAIAD